MYSVPRGNDLIVERLGEQIIRSEQQDMGRTVRKLSKVHERRLGCDFVSTDATGIEHLIEIKGWGESLRMESGQFRYTTELRTAQWKASAKPFWRLGIVANLTAANEGRGLPERLTLTGSDLERRTVPMMWEVWLDGLEGRVQEGRAPSLEDVDSGGAPNRPTHTPHAGE